MTDLRVPGRVYVRWSGNYWWDVVELPKHRVVLHCGTQDLAHERADRMNKVFKRVQEMLGGRETKTCKAWGRGCGR